VLGHYGKIQAEHSCENTTLKKGTGRIVIKQHVIAIQKLLLAIRACTWQALLHALATHAAMPSQYFSTESAEGIRRGGSRWREREDTEHTLRTTGDALKVLRPPPFVVMTPLMVTLLFSSVSNVVRLVRLS